MYFELAPHQWSPVVPWVVPWTGLESPGQVSGQGGVVLGADLCKLCG